MMTVSNEQLARMTASEFVAGVLRDEILNGELLPEQPLLQDHLAARFKVSQSSVREALRRLEALTLAYSVRNRGTFVSGLSVEQVEEIYDLRLAIEMISLRARFARLTDEDIAEAERLLADMSGKDHGAFAGDTHKRFHAIFVESPDRQLTNDLLRNLYGNLTRIWMALLKRNPAYARSNEDTSQRDHRELLDAARDRDLPRAEAILALHINNAKRRLIEQLRDAGKDQPPPDARPSSTKPL